MPSHVIEEIRDIGGRLDGVISFTIIRFIYAVCIQHLRNVEVALFGIIVSIVCSSALQLSRLSAASRIVGELMRKISLLVVAQALVSVIGIDATVAYTDESPPQLVMQSLTVLTCILILSSVVPTAFRGSELVQRLVTLLLFVYADASESLFRIVEDGIIPTLACLLLYVCMHHYSSEVKAHQSLTYITRALNMVSINFILRSLASLSRRQSASLPVQTVLYIVVLFIVDTVSHLSCIFNESRDYAMYKVSQQLFRMYAAWEVDFVLSMAGSILVLATRDAWSDNTQLVFQLVVLVFVSVVLDAASGFLQSSASVDKSVLLFVYVICIHRLSSSLL